jgi:hypothetical protein
LASGGSVRNCACAANAQAIARAKIVPRIIKSVY